jgi:hypothetical protein
LSFKIRVTNFILKHENSEIKHGHGVDTDFTDTETIHALSLLFHVLILLLEKLSDAISLSKLTQGGGHGYLHNSGYTDGNFYSVN